MPFKCGWSDCSLIVDGVRYSKSNYVAELFNSYFTNIADNFVLCQTISWDPSSLTQHVSKFEIDFRIFEALFCFSSILEIHACMHAETSRLAGKTIIFSEHQV